MENENGVKRPKANIKSETSTQSRSKVVDSCGPNTMLAKQKS